MNIQKICLFQEKGILFLSGVMVLTLLSGCGDHTLPTRVEESPLVGSSTGEEEIRKNPWERRRKGMQVGRMVGEEGGSVHLWHHSITIPKGALLKKTWISISWPEVFHPILNFGPSGIQFLNDQPGIIRISYKGDIFGNLKEENLHINQWDEERDVWINIGGRINLEEKYVEVYVTHLSRYALSDR